MTTYKFLRFFSPRGTSWPVPENKNDKLPAFSAVLMQFERLYMYMCLLEWV